MVGNPSLVFLDTKSSVSGSASAVVQGSRVVFVEVQALVVRKRSRGWTFKKSCKWYKEAPRLDMLCAVLSRR